MTRATRLGSCLGAALTAVLLWAVAGSPARPAEGPKGRPAVRLARGGQFDLPDLSVEDAAVIDDRTVILVGTRGGGEELPPDQGEPNGAVVHLDKRTARRFTNGHRGRICSVSVARGRVATTSTNRDPVLRVWDLKVGKSVAAVEIEKPGGQQSLYYAGCFHKSDRVAVTTGERLLVLDPARPGDRTELACPPAVLWLSGPVVVSPDDTHLVCTAGPARVVVWELATRKGTFISLLPKWAKPDDSRWVTRDVVFGPPGSLIACRAWTEESEVPVGKAETDVSAERRGVVRIDLPRGRVTPTGMGHPIRTLACAVDPTGEWLATAGSSRPDRPQPGGDNSVGELRVYHLPSKELAYREQVEGAPLRWVAFTPSGKRVVTTDYRGLVRWWNVSR